MENKANSFACQFRNKLNGKWSEWKTERWIPSRETVQVTHRGVFQEVSTGDDDFDLGYLQAVNWLYHKEREFAGRKDIEFNITPEHFSVFDQYHNNTVMFVLRHSTIGD